MLELRDISKSFNSTRLLSRVSLRLEDGESIMLYGKSGEGKTTLMKIIASYIEPDEGSVLIDGREKSKLEKGSVVYISQNALGSFDPRFKIEKSLKEAFYSKKSKKSDFDAESHFRELSLPLSLIMKRPYELSGGEISRVALIRGILLSPSVLILDETGRSLNQEDAKALLSYALKSIGPRSNLIYVTHEEEKAPIKLKSFTLSKGKLI